MRFLLIKTLLICCLTIFLSGCETLGINQGSSTAEDKYAGYNEAQFHKEAKEALREERYQKAVELYEALEARYPFGNYSAQTQLDLAYGYYKNGDAEASLAATERFIKINPRNPSIDYAYYLKGLVSYNRSIGLMDRFLPTDSSQRDVNGAQEAYHVYQELIRRFPNSKYVPDVKQRMIALKNNIAMHEIHVANYYFKRKAYVAAISRCNLILKDYQRTPAIPYALQLMEEAYTELGLTNLAKDAKQVFTTNYPKGVPELQDSKKSFVYDVWDFIGFDE
ncbi:MAG: outer membrane protein assembly factor BamD [Methylococcaceae bacterium]|nr:outer membrane protein assembly factor BamD [Methylococcaceae bacterium]